MLSVSSPSLSLKYEIFENKVSEPKKWILGQRECARGQKEILNLNLPSLLIAVRFTLMDKVCSLQICFITLQEIFLK